MRRRSSDGGPVGERHDQHLVEPRVAADQPIDDQVLDEEGLARPGRRLDDGRAIARDARQLGGEGVEDRRRGAHRRFLRGPAVFGANAVRSRGRSAGSTISTASASGGTG